MGRNALLAAPFPPRSRLARPCLRSDFSRGVFAQIAYARPNPIRISIAHLVGTEGAIVTVRGLDCLDGTPLLDLKIRSRFVHARRAADGATLPFRPESFD